MADRILSIFVDPPIAIARLGGSSRPMDAYDWAEDPQPRNDGKTTVVPAWSLRVLANGEVTPFLPTEIVFRDGRELRPVCPFLEVWAMVGDPDRPDAAVAQPLTEALLERFGGTPGSLRLSVDARNTKAAARASDPNLAFGTYPPLDIAGDDHTAHPILGSSPPRVSRPMIPRTRTIPLGSIQVLRPVARAAGADWPAEIRTDVIRVRVTPGRGSMYGPTGADAPRPGDTTTTRFRPVPTERAFLDPRAGWAGMRLDDANDSIQPADTFDGAEQRSGASLGIVDDTCEIQLTFRLTLGRRTLTARANVFVSPPDYAPDRRPFISLADEINDRMSDAHARTLAMTAEERDAWVTDFFERVHETVSLINVDEHRARFAADLSSAERTSPQGGDGLPDRRAMGASDRLRAPTAIAPRSTQNPLPLATHARTRHLSLSSLPALRALVASDPARISALVRAPFEVRPNEVGGDRQLFFATMRMPPFMRNSNGGPLAITAWQYELLVQWAAQVTGPAPPPAPPAPISEERADARRRDVLERLGPR